MWQSSPRQGVVLLVLFSAHLFCVTTADKYQELYQWIDKNGGKLRAVIESRPPRYIRGLYATEDALAGESLARIPLNLTIQVDEEGDIPSGVAWALRFLRAVVSPEQHHRPYVDILPGRDQIVCAEGFPKALIPLLQNHDLEDEVHRKQEVAFALFHGRDLRTEWGVRDTLAQAAPKSTLQDVVWALSMVTTRPISLKGIPYMIPIMDMMNHHESSENTVSVTETPEGRVADLILGHDIKAGEEVLFHYGPLRNDAALMYYGFLLDERPPRLLAVDCHNHDPYESLPQRECPEFTGSHEEVVKEAERIRGILQATEKLPAAATAGSSAKEIEFREMLLKLRELRREALKNELDRLLKVARGSASGVLDSEEVKSEL